MSIGKNCFASLSFMCHLELQNSTLAIKGQNQTPAKGGIDTIDMIVVTEAYFSDTGRFGELGPHPEGGPRLLVNPGNPSLIALPGEPECSDSLLSCMLHLDKDLGFPHCRPSHLQHYLRVPPNTLG